MSGPAWEHAAENLERVPVPGGWIYRTVRYDSALNDYVPTAPVFVPEVLPLLIEESVARRERREEIALRFAEHIASVYCDGYGRQFTGETLMAVAFKEADAYLAECEKQKGPKA